MHTRVEWKVSSTLPLGHSVGESWTRSLEDGLRQFSTARGRGVHIKWGQGFWEGEAELCATITLDWPTVDGGMSILVGRIEEIIARRVPDARFVHVTTYNVDMRELDLDTLRPTHYCAPECDNRVPGHPA
jgi:hypothetical protein